MAGSERTGLQVIDVADHVVAADFVESCRQAALQLALHLTHKERIIADLILAIQPQEAVLNDGVRVGRQRAVGERHGVVVRQPLAVVCAEVVARRRHCECVAVVARQTAVHGLGFLRTVGLPVNLFNPSINNQI